MEEAGTESYYIQDDLGSPMGLDFIPQDKYDIKYDYGILGIACCLSWV